MQQKPAIASFQVWSAGIQIYMDVSGGVGYRPKIIFALWSTVLVAGLLAAGIGKILIGSTESLIVIFCEAIAGGCVLAVVAHAMIPEAIHEGGSGIVLPTVAGFLVALYFALVRAFV